MTLETHRKLLWIHPIWVLSLPMRAKLYEAGDRKFHRPAAEIRSFLLKFGLWLKVHEHALDALHCITMSTLMHCTALQGVRWCTALHYNEYVDALHCITINTLMHCTALQWVRCLFVGLTKTCRYGVYLCIFGSIHVYNWQYICRVDKNM
jgi:hypothetical protein